MKKMKKQILKAIGGAALAILVLAVFAQVWISAQAQSGNEQGLIGSWDVQVTIRDCQTGTEFFSFPATNTYNQGGTMQESNLGPPGIVSLPAHGVWGHTRGRQYSAAYRGLVFATDPNRTFLGTGVVRQAINLGRDGDTFTSTDRFVMLDPNGAVIPGSEACATETATRFQ